MRQSETGDSYLDTINRMEPDIHMVDPGAFYASASISLHRIAHILEVIYINKNENTIARALWTIAALHSMTLAYVIYRIS